MPHGLDSDKELVLRWRWLPQAPIAPDALLPQPAYSDPERFRARALPDEHWESYRFNFAQLARQTPDLHFYRLVRVFNTPIVTMSHKEARLSRFAWWGGEPPEQTEGHTFAHFWFFRDQGDGALVVLEYGFDHVLRLRSDTKRLSDLGRFHDEMSAAL